MNMFIEANYYKMSEDISRNKKSEYVELFDKIKAYEKELYGKMDEGCKVLLNNYIDICTELYLMYEKDGYAAGFRNGALCMIDILREKIK